jgi:hypothetical protein
MPFPPSYNAKAHRVIQSLSKEVNRAQVRTQLGVLLTDPVLKVLPGPNATKPLEPGDTEPEDGVLAWFADVKLTDVDKDTYIRDALVPVQARSVIGEIGSPVVVWKDSVGNYMVIGRSDRRTDTQSVISYSLLDLDLGFLRGWRRIGTGDDWATAFYQYRAAQAAIVTSTRNGKQQAGVNRGITNFTSGGAPVTTYTVSTSFEDELWGDDADFTWGSDKFGVVYRVKTDQNGNTTKTKVQ